MKDNKNVILLVLLFVLLWTISPKNKNEQVDEINALAFSHRIYTTSTVCPNSIQLLEIKKSYLNTIPESKVQVRRWVEENFNIVFNKACSKIEYRQED